MGELSCKSSQGSILIFYFSYMATIQYSVNTSKQNFTLSHVAIRV